MKTSLKNEIKKILLDNIESSTSHGFPNIVRNESYLIKIMWIICLVASSAYCAYCLTKSFNEYFSFETNTQIKYKRESEIEFPTVTFCNKNPYNIHKNNNLTFLMKFGYTQLKEYLNNNIKDYKNLLILGNYFYEYQSLKYKQNLSMVAFSFDEMMIGCQFNYKECNRSDFKEFFSPKFGNCYQFNADLSSIKKISIPGKKSGLSLELFVGYPTVEYDLIKSYGAHLFVHNYSMIPYNDYEGISLSTGFSTDVIVNQISVNRLPKPFSDCIQNPFSLDSHDSYLYKETLKLYKKYQQKDCFDVCLQKKIFNKCGCWNPGAYGINYSDACNPDLGRDCVILFFKQMEENDNSDCFEKCPEECESTRFNLQTSQSIFPSPFYQDVLLRFDYTNNFSKSFYSYENIKSSTLAVNVYFDDISVIQIDETAAKTTEQLVADIGGFLGLCIGISILSVAEIFDSVLKIILLIIQRKPKSLITVSKNEQKI